MKVEEILQHKGSQVVTIEPDKTVQQAIALLVRKKIGALLVAEKKGKIVGIITERDILKEANRRSKLLAKTRVKQVMTRKLWVGAPDDDVPAVRQLMTRHRVRHLPIIAGNKLVGLISIGDVLKSLDMQREAENHDLKDLIAGRYVIEP